MSLLLLKLDEVAERLGVTRRYVERLVASKDLASIKLGGRARRVALCDLESFVAKRREGGDQ